MQGAPVYSARQLELVRALAEHRNFGRAATALGVSQPALTRSLKHLEDLIGASLFDRAGVTPTIFGEIMLKHGRPVLAGFAELQHEIAVTKGLEIGDLTVAMGPYPGDVSGLAAAALLSERHPRLSLDLRLTDWTRAQEAVLDGSADLAFADIRAAREDPNFVTEAVRAGRITFFCATSHPLARAKRVSFGELMSYPWTGPSFAAPVSDGMPKVEQPCGAFDPVTGRFCPRILVESFASAKRIVLTGIALSAGFPFQIGAEVKAGELCLLPVELPFLALDYGFVTKRGRALSPAARAFMEAVLQIESGIRG